MNVVDFPNDIFLIIAAHLTSQDLILCRRVSKAFYTTFTSPDLNRHLLISRYPRSRELRLLTHERPPPTSEPAWSQLFLSVALRYHYLQSGRPHQIEQVPLARSLVAPAWCRHYPVAKWQRYLHFGGHTAPFHYPDTQWTYDASRGILVYPSSREGSYVIHDLETGVVNEMGFEMERQGDVMVVRRLRLREGVLVVEWCEGEPWHQLNETEMVYRHFASAYDVVPDPAAEGKWDLVFRSEWKIHFLGMPLNSTDRFLSTHNATHYAMYLWQPNRSAWGEDEPIESLAIWDVSSPSPYRPSLDPSGRSKPSDPSGPRVVRRFSFSDLDFYNIRQRSTPVLRDLEIDEASVYVIEEDHRWMAGQQAGDSLPRLHMVRSVGIPFTTGPRWVHECGVSDREAIGTCGVQESKWQRDWPGWAPCWRHEAFPYITITQSHDSLAGLTFSARHCFMLDTLSRNIRPHINVRGFFNPVNTSTSTTTTTTMPATTAGQHHHHHHQLLDEVILAPETWQQLLAMGKICADERWLIGEDEKGQVVVMWFGQRKIGSMR